MESMLFRNRFSVLNWWVTIYDLPQNVNTLNYTSPNFYDLLFAHNLIVK